MSANSTIESVIAKLQRAEFSGSVAKSLTQGGRGEFALLLAMLQQDVSRQLVLADEPDKPLVGHIPIEQFNFYPKVPLKTEPNHYLQQAAFAQAIHRQDVTTASLLGCMFPSPLSLHNDAKRIDDTVKTNCDIYAQYRIQKCEDGETDRSDSVEVDPTMLYDTIAAAQAVQAA